MDTDSIKPPRFRPVVVKARADGWTPDRQRAFIAAIAQCGQLAPAARAVGMTVQSLGRLRLRPDAASFNRAIAKVIDNARAQLLSTTIERAIDGVIEPIYYRGRHCGDVRQFNDGLLIAALNRLMPVRKVFSGGP